MTLRVVGMGLAGWSWLVGWVFQLTLSQGEKLAAPAYKAGLTSNGLDIGLLLAAQLKSCAAETLRSRYKAKESIERGMGREHKLHMDGRNPAPPFRTSL